MVGKRAGWVAGRSYEEEMRQKQDAAQQQEQAVLKQIFEQNIRLREEISAVSAA